jgi:hypothetical protein
VSAVHVRVQAGDGVWLGWEKILIDDDPEIREAMGYFPREEITF